MDGGHVAACTAIAALAVLAALAGVAHAQDEDRLIPAWIRQIFVYYADEQISDAELVAALTYLIDNGIIVTNADGPSSAAPAAPMSAPLAPQAVSEAYIAASNAGMSAIADSSTALTAIENAFGLDGVAISAADDAVHASNTDAVYRAGERAAPSAWNAVVAADDKISAAIKAASTVYTTGALVDGIDDVKDLADAAILAGSVAEAYPYGSSDGAREWTKASKAWITAFKAQASLAADRASSLESANIVGAYADAADAYAALGADRAAMSLDRAARAWADAATAWADAAEAAERTAGAWDETADAWAEAAEVAAGSAGDGAVATKTPTRDTEPRTGSAGAPRTVGGGSTGAVELTAAERVVERARIVELQDLSGPRECYTLLRSMERNLIEQDGAESQIKFMRDYLAFAPDPNDPALQQSRSLLDSSTENLRVLQADYQTMKSTYDSYSQCR